MKNSKYQIQLNKDIKNVQNNFSDLMKCDRDKTFDVLTKQLNFIPVSFKLKEDQMLDNNVYFHPAGIFLDIGYTSMSEKESVSHGNIYFSGYKKSKKVKAMPGNSVVDKYGNLLVFDHIKFVLFDSNYLSSLSKISKGCYINEKLPEMFDISSFFQKLMIKSEQAYVLIDNMPIDNLSFFDNRDGETYQKILDKKKSNSLDYTDLINNRSESSALKNYFLLSEETIRGWLGNLYEETSYYKKSLGCEGNIPNQEFFKKKDFDFINICGEMTFDRLSISKVDKELLGHKIIDTTNILHCTSKIDKHYPGIFRESILRIKENYGIDKVKEMLFEVQETVFDGTPVQSFLNNSLGEEDVTKKEIKERKEGLSCLFDIITRKDKFYKVINGTKNEASYSHEARKDKFYKVINGTKNEASYSHEVSLFIYIAKACDALSDLTNIDDLISKVLEDFDEKDLNYWIGYNDTNRFSSENLSSFILSHLQKELIKRSFNELNKNLDVSKVKRKTQSVL